MLATTVLLLLLGWLCCTTVLAICAAPPREEVHRAEAGAWRPVTQSHHPEAPSALAEQVAYRPPTSQATPPQPETTLPQPRLRDLVER